MTSNRRCRRIARLLGAAAISASLLIAAPAFAAPGSLTSTNTPSAIVVPQDTSTLSFQQRVATKQAQLQQFTDQLDQLDTDLQVAEEDYNRAQIQLQQMQAQVQTAQTDSNNALQAYKVQTEVLASRADSMYKNGSLATINVLLDSKDFGDFVARVKFINAIGLRDADVAASLRAQRDLMAKQVADLQTAQQQAQSLEFELKARRIEIGLRIQERQQMYASVTADLQQMLNKQAVQRNGQEMQLLQQVLAGASKAGIQVQPGSPVETALAYHGIPYVWGGDSPAKGFDCSGLIMYVFAQHGVKLPHYSGDQFKLGTKVPINQLLPGDCIFFGNPVHHVAMYIGGGYVVQAPHTGDVVKISALSDLAGLGIAGARRYPWQLRIGPPLGAR